MLSNYAGLGLMSHLPFLPGVEIPGLCHHACSLWLKVQSQAPPFLGNGVYMSVAW